MVGGEGQTVPERFGPRGADNATNPEFVCLPCALLGNQLGGAPTQKKSFIGVTVVLFKTFKEASFLSSFMLIVVLETSFNSLSQSSLPLRS